MPFWPFKRDSIAALDPPAHGPDFSGVDSLDKAHALALDGVLEPLHLMPEEFGGADHPGNVVYVPRGLAAVKQGTDLNIIAPLIEAGDVLDYSATPEYRGDSFVPVSIRIEATGAKRFATEIAIWGEALDGQTGEETPPPSERPRLAP